MLNLFVQFKRITKNKNENENEKQPTKVKTKATQIQESSSAAAAHPVPSSDDDSEDDEVINAFTAMIGEPEEPEEPGVEYVGLEDMIVSLGYVHIEGSKGKKCMAGKTKEEAKQS